MKKFLLIVLAAGLMFSCQKKADETAVLQEVSFSAIQVSPDGLKSTEDWPCKADVPTHAWVTIGGVDYYPELFTLDGVLYTQAIKFPVGQLCVTKFVLYKEVDGVLGVSIPGGDIVVFGTPVDPSAFEVYINPLYQFPYCFTVGEFVKTQVPIEVLCYQDAYYDKFGFNWFAITEIVIREQCFFGDLCVKHPGDYKGSDYDFAEGSLKIDMPAIFKLLVFDELGNPVPFSPFSNLAWHGVGAPLCIQYPDNLSIEGELFTVELWVQVKQGDAFPFVKFKTWTFEDEEMITAGQDGIVDFVIGNCNLTDPDFQFAPWQNLPVTANVTIANPGTLPSYWDVTFNSFTPTGTYDVTLGLHDGWCGDEFTTIPNSTFNANLYTSLNDAGWPIGIDFTLDQMSEINWLMNHLQNYGINPPLIGEGPADDVQKAIWNIIRGAAYYTGVPATMYNDAVAHPTFVPLPGGFAAVLIVRDNLPDAWQLVFVVVDP